MLYKKIHTLITSKVLFMFLILCCHVPVMAVVDVDAEKGVLDLRNYDFDIQPSLRLGGEWKFLPGKVTTNFDSVMQLGTILKIGKQSWKDVGYENVGCGTYAVQIKLNDSYINPAQKSSLGFKINNIFDSYKIYINGEIIGGKGMPSEDANKHVMQMGYQLIFFTPKTNYINLLIPVANSLNHQMPGIQERMVLSSQHNTIRNGFFQNYLFIISFGVMILFTLYHLVFFLLRREAKENLYFAIVCFLFALKCLTEGDKMIFYFLPDFSTVFYYKLWFILVDIIYFLAVFYHIQFPNEIKKKVVRFTFWIFLLFTLLVIILPTHYGFVLSKIVYLYSIVLIVFVWFQVLLAVIRKREYAIPNLIGITISTIFGINDLLFALNIIDTGYYSAWGFCFYIIILSAMLSYKAAKAFHNVEVLTKQLAYANNNLETLVAKRTEELYKTNQELMHTNATKDRFFTILAHDLRSPISTIRSLIELMVIRHESYSKEKIAQMIFTLNESSRSTYDLLDNLLNWAKAQRKEIYFVPRFCLLHEMIDDTVALFATTVQQKNIQLYSEVSRIQKVYCDTNSMTTVIRNLINNAIKFTPSGGSIRVRSYYSGNNTIIEIIDTGVGMSEDTAKALFNNDVVLQSNRGTAGEKGSGLGLVLCRDFVNLHKGNISVESETGKGSCFRISLPLPSEHTIA